MDGALIRDLASRAGTFVNGRQIHRVEIHSGDEIKIGETTMRHLGRRRAATATESLRASTGARLPDGDLSVETDDLIDLEPAPAPPPRWRPTPQPGDNRKGRSRRHPFRPQRRGSLELVRDRRPRPRCRADAGGSGSGLELAWSRTLLPRHRFQWNTSRSRSRKKSSLSRCMWRRARSTPDG